MIHFMTYVKSAYELILSAEERALVNLDHEIEAYVVHTLARFWENPHIPTDAVAISLMEAMNYSGEERKLKLQKVAEECILIDGFYLNKRRWPSEKYYLDMGQLALGYRAYTTRPPELYYQKIADSLPTISRVLHQIKTP
jgi:hypothetical protein